MRYESGENNMRRKKILIIALICLMTAASFAACDNATGGNDMSAIEIMARSAEVMDGVDNFESTMESETTMSMLGETISMTMVADMVVNMDPMKMSMEMIMTIPGVDEVIAVGTYVVHEGDELITYMYMMGEWMKQTMPFSEELWNELAQAQSAQTMYELMKSAEIIGEETVNGVRSWIIEVTMSGDAMHEFMASMPGDTAEMFDPAMFAAMGDMHFTVWVAQNTFYQVRMIMDMTEMMNEMMGPMGVEIDNMTITMDSFNFGHAPAVVLPAEAANAVEAILF